MQFMDSHLTCSRLSVSGDVRRKTRAGLPLLFLYQTPLVAARFFDRSH